MSEIDDIQSIIHDIKDLESILNCCRNSLEKSEKRMDVCKKKMDVLTNHKNVCLHDECSFRQKFPPRDPHHKDQGCWP